MSKATPGVLLWAGSTAVIYAWLNSQGYVRDGEDVIMLVGSGALALAVTALMVAIVGVK